MLNDRITRLSLSFGFHFDYSRVVFKVVIDNCFSLY